MGIAIKNRRGQLIGTDSLLLQVSDKFSKMSDSTTKAAIATEIFGRSGTQMLPMLNMGTAAIKAQMEEAERLGIVWTDKAAAGSVIFNDTLETLKLSLDGVKRATILPVLERLTPIMSTLTENLSLMLPVLKEVGKNFKNIFGITYRDKYGNIIRNNQEQILLKDLNIFPSPYLEGIFDEIMNQTKINFQAIVETNRGCPFGCSYCSWGQGGLSKRYRFFSPQRIEQIAEWTGKNKIGYVFCADSNFGMFKEDIKTAKSFVNVKQKYNFPEKFRVCYSKNTEENVFEIGKLLHENKMEKSITLSLQTASSLAADNVRRQNIKMEVFNNLQQKYNEAGIPTYTELILGLPGETYESFLEGIENCLKSGIENQLFSYHCQIYPNAEMGNIEYQKKYGIKTIKCPLKEVHAVPRESGIPEEYEEVIIATNTMPEQDWKKAYVVSLVMQLFHGLKVAFYPMKHIVNKYNIKYTDFFDYISNTSNILEFPTINKEITEFWNTMDLILNGESKCKILSEFSPIYWEPEEIAFLNISNKKSEFYKELLIIMINYLNGKKIEFNEKELEEVVKKQEDKMPDYNKHFSGDKKRFAKEVLLWGRKSGKILRNE